MEEGPSAGTSSLISEDLPEKSGDKLQDTASFSPPPVPAAESRSDPDQPRKQAHSTASSMGGSTHATTSGRASHPASSEEGTTIDKGGGRVQRKKP